MSDPNSDNSNVDDKNMPILQWFCRWMLFRVLKWRMIGGPPIDEPRYVFAALPHTSNWDFFYGWLVIHALGLKVTIFVKDIFFIGLLKYISPYFGVAPVNRRESTNFVDMLVEQFALHEALVVLIAPEGTRAFRSQLKSGYYYAAKGADVPIVVAGPNFAEKTFTLSPPRRAMSSFEEDQADLIEFCRTHDAKIKQNSFQ